MGKLKEKYEEVDPITWLQVHNLLPILLSILLFLFVFYIVNWKLDQMSLKLKYQDAQVELAIKQKVSEAVDARLKELGKVAGVASPSAVKKIK